MSEKEFIKLEDIKIELEKRQDLIKELNKFEKIVAVTRGGLFVTGLLTQFIDARWIDTVCVKTYKGVDLKNEESEIIKMNSTNEKVLLVEDIVDTGQTLQYLKPYFPNAKVFSIHVKSLKTTVMPDYYLWDTDAWIVYPWEIDQ